MNLTDALREALDEHWGKDYFTGTKVLMLVKVPQRLDELTGHTELLEACKRARREIDNAVRLRLCCEQWDTSYLTAAIADADK